MKHFRQGDVLIVRTTKRALKGTAAKRMNGKLVLAEGEATGHAHTISEADVDLLIAEAEAFIQVASTATVTHPEHAPVVLPRGTYRVTRQREYQPEAIRTIAD